MIHDTHLYFWGITHTCNYPFSPPPPLPLLAPCSCPLLALISSSIFHRFPRHLVLRTHLEKTRLTSLCLFNLEYFRPHGERLKFAAGCLPEVFSPPPPTGSLQMAKHNQERTTLEALPSPSTGSSSSLMAAPRRSQSAGVGASTDGHNLEFVDPPSVERATSHRHASTSPRCAFSCVQDYAHRLNRDPSSSPYVDFFFTTLQVPGGGNIGENRRFGTVPDQCT